MPNPTVVDLTLSDEEKPSTRTLKHESHVSSTPPLAFRITSGDGSQQSPLDLEALPRPPSPSIHGVSRPFGSTSTSASKRKQQPFQNPISALKKAPSTPSKRAKEATEPVPPKRVTPVPKEHAPAGSPVVNDWPKCVSCSDTDLNCDGERPCSECAIFGLHCVYATDPPEPRTPKPSTRVQLPEHLKPDRSPRPEPLTDETVGSKATTQPFVSAFAGIESGADTESELRDLTAHSDVILDIGFFENLMQEFLQKTSKFHEYTVKPLLQQSRIDSKTRDTSSVPQPSKSPFNCLLTQPQDSTVPGPKIHLQVKGYNPPSQLLQQKWNTIKVPIVQIQTSVSSLPKYKSIGRMYTSVLARNVTIGKYNHYVPDDEENTWADLEHKYQEVSERYHTYEAISETLHGQRNCAELVDIWRPWAEKFIQRVGIHAAHVVRYYIEDRDMEDVVEIELSGRDREAWLSERNRGCSQCKMRTDWDRTVPWSSISPLLKVAGLEHPDSTTLARAGLACWAFHKVSGFSLWHIASTSPLVREALNSIRRKDEGIGDAERMCLVCGLHNCSIHGAYIENAAPRIEHLERDFDKIEHEDPESERNTRINVTLPVRGQASSGAGTPKHSRRKKMLMGSRKPKFDASKGKTVCERDVFIPCSHAGPCHDNSGCSCAREKVACEYFCGCELSCQRRFKGCSCAAGPTRVCFNDSRCECWMNSRECDPWLCKGCGLLEVLDQANKYNEEMRYGRCRNNRIQLGIPARTIKAPSEVQGYGLFAGEDLEEGDFIGEYKGEIISQPESDRRGAISHLLGAEYLFILNANQQVDASNFGNKTRFMNNSNVDANINVSGVTMLCNGVNRVMLHARRKIKAGEELLYNYSYPDEVRKHFWERGQQPSSKKALLEGPVSKVTAAKKEQIQPRTQPGSENEEEIPESSQLPLVKRKGKRKFAAVDADEEMDVEVANGSDSSYSGWESDESSESGEDVMNSSPSSDSDADTKPAVRINNRGMVDGRFGGKAQRKAAQTRAKRLAGQTSNT